MIEAKKLCKTYQITKKKLFFNREKVEKKAVDSVDFTIKEGEMIAYLGVNGSGKSTTIKMLTGILVPTDGYITVFGKNPYKHRKEIAKHIGVVFGQRSQLIWDLPVIDSYKLYSRIYDISKEDFKNRMNYILESLEISDLMSVPVRKLSLGQRMCCEIAIATIHNPKLLVLDEPTIGLDIFNKEKIRKFISDINNKFGTTIFLTTHDLGDVEAICDKIILINNGKKLYEGTIQQLKEDFGQNNKIKLTFNTVDKMNSINFEGFDYKKDIEEKSVLIYYNKNKFSANEMIKLLNNKCCDLKDISIIQTNLEEIIKNIHNETEL